MITEFMEEYVAQGLMWCLIGAWRALPLFAIVFVVDLLTKLRIAARFHCLMWTLVLIRMACPVSVPSGFSMHGYVDGAAEWALTEPATVAVPDVPFDTFTFHDANGESKTAPYFPDATEEEQAETDAYMAAQPMRYVSAGGEYNQISQNEAAIDWETLVSFSILLTWLSAAMGLLLRGGVQYLRFSLRIRHFPEVTEQGHIDEVLRVCDALNCRRRPRLKEVDGLTIPAVFGLFRHVICLPPGTLQELSAAEFRMVLRHEIAHITRCDLLLSSVAVFIRACHWFNPLAWLAVSRLKNHMEQAADDRATRSESRQFQTDYGRLLLKYAAGSDNAPQPVTMGLLFVSGKRRLKQRIDMLDKNDQRNRATGRGIAAAVLLLLAVSGLTDAKIPEAVAAMDFQPWREISPQTHAGKAEATNSDQKTEVTYDVRAAMLKLNETLIESERTAEFYITTLLNSQAIENAAQIVDGQLTVSQTAAEHSNTKSLLHAWERSGAWQITLECQHIVADFSIAGDFDWTPTQRDDQLVFSPTQSPRGLLSFETPTTSPTDFESPVAVGTMEVNMHSPVIATTISKFQKRLLLARAQTDVRSNILHTPKVTLFNGQCANLSDEVTRPFVTGVRPVLNPDQKFQPIIQTVSEGWSIRVHSEVTEDNDIDLQCAITESKLLGVELAHLPFSLDNNANPSVTVQVPNVSKKSLRSSARLAVGESLLIASPITFNPDSREQESMACFYLVTPTLIAEDRTSGDR